MPNPKVMKLDWHKSEMKHFSSKNIMNKDTEEQVRDIQLLHFVKGEMNCGHLCPRLELEEH